MPHPKARHFASPPQFCTVEIVRTQRDILVPCTYCVLEVMCWGNLSDLIGAVVSPLILILTFKFLVLCICCGGSRDRCRCLRYKRKCPEKKVQRCVVLSHQLLPEKSKGAPCVIAAAGSVCAVSLSTGGCGQSDRVSPYTVLGCLW